MEAKKDKKPLRRICDPPLNNIRNIPIDRHNKKIIISLLKYNNLILKVMNTATYNVGLPKADLPFMQKLAKRMGWTLTEAKPADALFDPECGCFLNEETMQAIRDVEAGHGVQCAESIDDLIATL